MMRTLLVADHDNRRLSPLAARVLTAARPLDAPVDVLVIGHGCDAVADAAALLTGVSRVRLLDAPHYADLLAENLAMVIAQLAGSYSHVLFSASSFGKALAPRVAAMLDVAPVSGVTRILAPDCFQRPSHAGNVIETVQCDEPVRLLSIHAAAFEPAAAGPVPATISELPAGPDMGVSQVVSRELHDSGSRPPLEAARVVVSGGRGLGSAEAFERLLLPLADRFGAAPAATRAAVDAGFAPNDWQVGQTGKTVEPELYLAVGISGALQHLSGMRNAGCIVAINKDPEAEIFRHADFGLVGDAAEILPQLLAELGG